MSPNVADFRSVLITGASGLLGANLVMHASQRSKQVVAMYHRHKFEAPGVTSLQVNLTAHAATSAMVKRLQPQWVIHCAALTDVDWCEEHPQEAKLVNEEASRNLAVATRQVGAKMVFVSTDSVFEGQRGNYNEEDIAEPINIYARSKLAGERAVTDELEQALIIRTNIYGWNSQDKQSLGEWVFNRLVSGQIVPGFYDVSFTPILVNDLGDAILNLMELQSTGVYHVGGSKAISKYDFAVELAETFGLSRQLIYPASIGDAQLKAPRPQKTGLQTDKVSRQLGRPMPDVGSGLRRFRLLHESGYAKRLKE